LGRAGLRMSVYGLGANAFGARADEAASIALIHHALDHGVDLIDTTNRSPATPGVRILSETITGTALKGRRG
jgi:aryl-alcohol dehydrogenase-like predicted oxidoreductase